MAEQNRGRRGGSETHPFSAEGAAWARGAFEALGPLIASVTEVYPPPNLWRQYQPIESSLEAGWTLLDAYPRVEGPHLDVGLRLPKRSYWVTHPGPDGKPDGPSLMYDPSNGVASTGHIA